MNVNLSFISAADQWKLPQQLKNENKTWLYIV